MSIFRHPSILVELRWKPTASKAVGLDLEDVAKIREITKDFHLPEYACVTYRALMSGLQELEQDLHMHIHLENNVLFPRALRLEAA